MYRAREERTSFSPTCTFNKSLKSVLGNAAKKAKGAKARPNMPLWGSYLKWLVRVATRKQREPEKLCSPYMEPDDQDTAGWKRRHPRVQNERPWTGMLLLVPFPQKILYK
ncbi:hypothetical protein NPIL_200851 [Nephila pilipes]|uniref:Uncharacterized protein n=1 Tax=Nephila pilipes TaxID=299642 RepID=A0A8X6NGJ3_NEPPI|nr:hypothetical protein NPIL_200851 [Nephila pilipes]